MISAQEIRTAEFDRAMRGYRCEDVQDYLEQVAQALENKEAELADMKSKILILAQKVEEYRRDEDTLKTAMINAQRMGESVIKEAKQKAEEIIREANIRAEDREQHAQEEVARAQEEVDRLHSEVSQFKKQILALYMEHIKSLSSIAEEAEGAISFGNEPPAEKMDAEEVEPVAPEPAEPYDARLSDSPETGTTGEISFSRTAESARDADEEDAKSGEEENDPDDEESAAGEDDYAVPASLGDFHGISFND